MLTIEEWVQERLDNCLRLAVSEYGEIREGWLEDARYFQMILDVLRSGDKGRQADLGHAPV